ncbi:MAG: Asp-tRNA(Asn)/Glu-tRNA(Gln) amidotransferase subunit GatC [Anaerolineae bacterium]|nr:Asp-tRNA(Asn)/Glu-tRNA(Gln) amidotransferase subunit GatC [Anaerolineae bacterium]
MKIEVEQVEQIARLAHLALTEEEKAVYASQLSAILDYFAKLDEVDTAHVAPMSHPLALEIPLRPDESHISYPRESILANAPDREGDLFRVPVVIEQE